MEKRFSPSGAGAPSIEERVQRRSLPKRAPLSSEREERIVAHNTAEVKEDISTWEVIVRQENIIFVRGREKFGGGSVRARGESNPNKGAGSISWNQVSSGGGHGSAGAAAKIGRDYGGRRQVWGAIARGDSGERRLPF